METARGRRKATHTKNRKIGRSIAICALQKDRASDFVVKKNLDKKVFGKQRIKEASKIMPKNAV